MIRYKGNWCTFVEKQIAVEVVMPRVGKTDPGKDTLAPGAIRPRRKEDFDASYATTPVWQIGYPQPAFQALADSGALKGRILDVGCGTGEHALMAAAIGLDATGIDLAQTAIAAAQAEAESRGLNAHFLVWDALQLPSRPAIRHRSGLRFVSCHRGPWPRFVCGWSQVCGSNGRPVLHALFQRSTTGPLGAAPHCSK